MICGFGDSIKVLRYSFAIIIFLTILPFLHAGDAYEYEVHAPVLPDLGALKTHSEYYGGGFTGAFVYTYNLELPPGTNGLTPRVTLVYNNQMTKSTPTAP